MNPRDRQMVLVCILILTFFLGFVAGVLDIYAKIGV